MAKRKKRNRKETAHPASRGRQIAKPAPSAKRSSAAPLWAAIVLAAMGLGLTGYLTATQWLGEHAAYCAAGSGCDLVQSSRWSVLLGVPLSAWGFLLYAILLLLLWRMRHRPSLWVRTLTLAGFGFGFSVYLTVISVVEIEATCTYCLASFAILTTIFAILLVTRPDLPRPFNWASWTTGCFGATAVLVGILQFHYSGVFDPAAGPEKPYLKELALHLQDSGAKFYSAYWCPRCQAQKDTFEASAHRLPYVECTPSGRNGPRSVSCINNNINRYPTWIIDGRHHEGLLEPKALAVLSRLEWEEPQ